mmetsp:Transcript_73708/g.208753  ORF Transcript_73708/g.208753 Transcript_73708/m.208753 type:complete len:818 (-) Transcript_73708:188-2641(-)
MLLQPLPFQNCPPLPQFDIGLAHEFADDPGNKNGVASTTSTSEPPLASSDEASTFSVEVQAGGSHSSDDSADERQQGDAPVLVRVHAAALPLPQHDQHSTNSARLPGARVSPHVADEGVDFGQQPGTASEQHGQRDLIVTSGRLFHALHGLHDLTVVRSQAHLLLHREQGDAFQKVLADLILGPPNRQEVVTAGLRGELALVLQRKTRRVDAELPQAAVEPAIVLVAHRALQPVADLIDHLLRQPALLRPQRPLQLLVASALGGLLRGAPGRLHSAVALAQLCPAPQDGWPVLLCTRTIASARLTAAHLLGSTATNPSQAIPRPAQGVAVSRDGRLVLKVSLAQRDLNLALVLCSRLRCCSRGPPGLVPPNFVLPLETAVEARDKMPARHLLGPLRSHCPCQGCAPTTRARGQTKAHHLAPVVTSKNVNCPQLPPVVALESNAGHKDIVLIPLLGHPVPPCAPPLACKVAVHVSEAVGQTPSDKITRLCSSGRGESVSALPFAAAIKPRTKVGVEVTATHKLDTLGNFLNHFLKPLEKLVPLNRCAAAGLGRRIGAGHTELLAMHAQPRGNPAPPWVDLHTGASETPGIDDRPRHHDRHLARDDCNELFDGHIVNLIVTTERLYIGEHAQLHTLVPQERHDAAESVAGLQILERQHLYIQGAKNQALREGPPMTRVVAPAGPVDPTGFHGHEHRCLFHTSTDRERLGVFSGDHPLGWAGCAAKQARHPPRSAWPTVAHLSRRQYACPPGSCAHGPSQASPPSSSAGPWCPSAFPSGSWGRRETLPEIFLPPVSLPIFQISFEIRHADRPHRTKPIGE